MSYILDALKKSEAERDPNAAIALLIADAEHTQAARKNHQLVLWVIGVALVANAAVLAVWLPGWTKPLTATMAPVESGLRKAAAAEDAVELTPRIQPAIESSRGPVADRSTDPAVDPSAGRKTDPSSDPGTDRSTELAALTSSSVAIEPTQTPPRPLPRVQLDELPFSLRSAFMELTFSTHVFAADPALRAIVVNGTRRIEGDTVEGMAVEEITEDGVVLRVDDYLVEISVLEAWEDL